MTDKRAAMVIMVQEGFSPEDLACARLGLSDRGLVWSPCGTLYEAAARLACRQHDPSFLILSAWSWSHVDQAMRDILYLRRTQCICWAKTSWDMRRLLKNSAEEDCLTGVIQTFEQLLTLLDRMLPLPMGQNVEKKQNRIVMNHCAISEQEMRALLDESEVAGGV